MLRWPLLSPLKEYAQMADQSARLEAATIKAEIGSGIVYRFSNDAATDDDIPTLSGEIPNLKNVILRIQNEGVEKISFATKIFIDTAAGIAGTSNQEIFLVQSAEPGEIYQVWQNVSGAAVDTGKRSISAAAVIEATEAATAAAASAQESADAATMRVARFLEPSATPPIQRDDGQPLQFGDRYLNTTDQIEYIYKTSGWVANNLDAQELSSPDGAERIGAMLPNGESGTAQDAIDYLGVFMEKVDGLALPSGSGMVGHNTSETYASGTAGAAINAAQEAADYAKASAGKAVPPGAVMLFALSTAPAGWLKANGAAVSRTTYADLFAAIGTTYGAGNGTTTFNVPDTRGQFVRGWDDGRGIDPARAFGSDQKGSIVAEDFSLSGASAISLHNSVNNDPVQFWQNAGYDLATSSYPNIDISIVSGGVDSSDIKQMGVTRPSNIAFMYCIKV